MAWVCFWSGTAGCSHALWCLAFSDCRAVSPKKWFGWNSKLLWRLLVLMAKMQWIICWWHETLENKWVDAFWTKQLRGNSSTEFIARISTHFSCSRSTDRLLLDTTAIPCCLVFADMFQGWRPQIVALHGRVWMWSRLFKTVKMHCKCVLFFPLGCWVFEVMISFASSCR